MSARHALRPGFLLVIVLSAACEESSSGADREAKRSRFASDTTSSGGGTAKAGATSQGCGDVTEVGSCLGSAITFCDDGTLVSADCRELGADCTCDFDEDERLNHCLCGSAAGTGGSGGTGGGTGGTGGNGGMGGSGGTGGTGGNGGTGGGSAAGTTGGSAGSGTCLEAQARCGESTSTCCAEHRCISYDGAAAVCVATCTRNSECDNGCCALLTDFGGACSPVGACGGTACRPRGASCDSAANCCQESPTTCVDPDRGGPKVCSAVCVVNSDCQDGCCRTDSHGVRACFPVEFCQ